jgi:hypothetical protein
VFGGTQAVVSYNDLYSTSALQVRLTLPLSPRLAGLSVQTVCNVGWRSPRTDVRMRAVDLFDVLLPAHADSNDRQRNGLQRALFLLRLLCSRCLAFP